MVTSLLFHGLERSRFNYLCNPKLSLNCLFDFLWSVSHFFYFLLPPSKWISKLDRTFHSIWLVWPAPWQTEKKKRVIESDYRSNTPKKQYKRGRIKDAQYQLLDCSYTATAIYGRSRNQVCEFQVLDWAECDGGSVISNSRSRWMNPLRKSIHIG